MVVLVVGLGSIVISNLVIVLFVDWRVLPVCPPFISLIYTSDSSTFDLIALLRVTAR